MDTQNQKNIFYDYVGLPPFLILPLLCQLHVHKHTQALRSLPSPVAQHPSPVSAPSQQESFSVSLFVSALSPHPPLVPRLRRSGQEPHLIFFQVPRDPQPSLMQTSDTTAEDAKQQLPQAHAFIADSTTTKRAHFTSSPPPPFCMMQLQQMKTNTVCPSLACTQCRALKHHLLSYSRAYPSSLLESVPEGMWQENSQHLTQSVLIPRWGRRPGWQGFPAASPQPELPPCPLKDTGQGKYIHTHQSHLNASISLASQAFGF